MMSGTELASNLWYTVSTEAPFSCKSSKPTIRAAIEACMGAAPLVPELDKTDVSSKEDADTTSTPGTRERTAVPKLDFGPS